MINAGIFGVTGYTGYELVQILTRHPQVTVVFGTSESRAGERLEALFPQAPPLTMVSSDEAPLEEIDVAFLCLPHAAAAETAVRALDAGCRVVDLSADFRLRDAVVYEKWYGTVHPAPALLDEAVYGLTEAVRGTLPDARLVANPGCYPTSVLLALQPLLRAGSVDGPIIADSKSGVSGAGRSPKQHTHFVEVADNFSAYAIGRAHRHLPEMEQQLAQWNRNAPMLIFSPHLLPVPRGILSTIYVPLPDAAARMSEIRALYEEAYAGEPFVHLLPAGQTASLAHVVHTNRCVMGLTPAGSTLIITSALDNLVKGAAGQAVQNMNVMFGRPETEGLL